MDQEPAPPARFDRPPLRLARRAVIAGGAALLPTGLAATPAATDVGAWIAYRERLTARLGDHGGGRFDAAASQAALRIANAARAAAGAPALVGHDGLARTARAHAADLAHRRYVEHLSPEGFDPSHRFWLIERRTVGSPSENIAYHRGPAAPSAERLVNEWRESAPHWKNLLKPGHTHGGFGVIRKGDRAYIVGLFLTPVASLTAPLPFRIRDFDAARAAIKGWDDLPSGVRPRVGSPQGAGRGGAPGAPPWLMQLALRRRGGAPGAPPWLMQLALRRQLDEHEAELIGGPIFVMGG